LDAHPGVKTDNGFTDPLLALVMTPGFYLHHLEVTDQEAASGNL